MTISLPDDVAERLETEPNASAFIAGAVRQVIRSEHLARTIAEDGYTVTPAGRARMRERIAAARNARQGAE